ncbi:protein of unknown function [Latilactobacillus sakei]|nr:protein of unknown function [Latilactobacillus sakei]
MILRISLVREIIGFIDYLTDVAKRKNQVDKARFKKTLSIS